MMLQSSSTTIANNTCVWYLVCFWVIPVDCVDWFQKGIAFQME